MNSFLQDVLEGGGYNNSDTDITHLATNLFHIQLFKLYVEKIRPQIATASSNKIALLTSMGQTLNNYRDLLCSLAKRLGLGRLPNFLTIRKARATAVVTTDITEGLKLVSKHISRSQSTSKKLPHVWTTQGSKKSFDKIKDVVKRMES